jgi:hypothetical protein
LPKNFRTISVVLGEDQIRAIEAIRQHQMEVNPHRRVSVSDVMREIVADGLTVVAKREGIDLEALFAQITDEVAV